MSFNKKKYLNEIFYQEIKILPLPKRAGLFFVNDPNPELPEVIDDAQSSRESDWTEAVLDGADGWSGVPEPVFVFPAVFTLPSSGNIAVVSPATAKWSDSGLLFKDDDGL